MHSATVWWSHLVVFSQIFWGISLFGTIVLLMQIGSMFLGFENIGGHDTDSVDSHDSGSGEGQHGFMAGLKFLTFRCMIAFVCMFGWTGLVCIEYGASKIMTCILSLIVGCFSMFVVAVFMKVAYSMQASGNVKEDAFVGKEAVVYIPIPEKGKGFGKINLNMNGRLEERVAVSNGLGIPVGTTVKVISYSNNTFTIERA
jgi:membrane protein implicated in regulation of membrane protease activity